MTLPRLLWTPVLALDNRRPRFFSRYEWRYHVLMMPLLFAVGNYYFIGSAYFKNARLFWIGTGLVFGLYWLSVILLTLVIRWTIRRYPTVNQTVSRTVVMLILVIALTTGLAVFDVWMYSLVPMNSLRFDWAAVGPIWILGLVFDIFLCLALNLFYTYSQWQQELTESEQLQRVALQQQYDRLKSQLNPHFLFNALNSLSVLIGEDRELAEQFVDKLASVYRYMLQAGPQTSPPSLIGQEQLVTLQAELAFITIYAELLQVRYGQSLRIEQPSPIPPADATRCLPVLSLLTLVENALRHNGMSVKNPLIIRIHLSPDGKLCVTNNRQRRSLRFETSQVSLADLIAKYRLIADQPVLVNSTDTHFTVSLPLLTVTELG